MPINLERLIFDPKQTYRIEYRTTVPVSDFVKKDLIFVLGSVNQSKIIFFSQNFEIVVHYFSNFALNKQLGANNWQPISIKSTPRGFSLNLSR